MDFGDYTYIILAILFSVISAVGKKRKSKAKTAKPSKARSILEELFDPKSGIEDPIPQPIYVDETEGETFADVDEFEDADDEVVPPISDLQAKLNSLYTKDEVEDKPLVVLRKANPIKRHNLVENLKKHSELQKAVVYSEIFKTKF